MMQPRDHLWNLPARLGPQDRLALFGALLNLAVLAGWVGAGSWLRITPSTIGASLFWTLPTIVAALLWFLVACASPRELPLGRRVGAVVAGSLATALGCPLSIATGVLIAFGALGPLVFLAVPVELAMLLCGFLVMWTLWRLALAALAGEA